MQKKNMSKKEEVYNIIRRRIIYCELAPGEIIIEEKLCEEFSVSRTPVREALNDLMQEGFVNIYPRRAITVSPITIETIEDIFEIRELIEPYIVSQITELENNGLDVHLLLEKAESISPRDDILSMAEKDIDYHNYIFQPFPNKTLLKMLNNIRDQEFRIRLSNRHLLEGSTQTREEHVEIAKYIIEKNAEKAKETMYNHLQRSRQTFIGQKRL